MARNSPDPDGSEPSDPDERAAWLSAQHAQTPTVVHLDSLGRPFLSVAHNVTGVGSGRVHEFYKTRTVLDIEGNTLAIYDAKQHDITDADNLTLSSSAYSTIAQTFDVLQRRLLVTSPDAGERLAVQDGAGKPLRSYNSRGFTTRERFDAAQRATHSLVHDGISEALVGRIVYGEELDDSWTNAASQTVSGPSIDPADPSPAQQRNLRGSCTWLSTAPGR